MEDKWVYWTEDNVTYFPVIITDLTNISLKAEINVSDKIKILKYMQKNYPTTQWWDMWTGLDPE